MGKITGILLSKAANGDFGPKVKAAYWWLAGHKTKIGAIFAFTAAVIEAADHLGLCADVGLDCNSLSVVIAKVIAIGGSLGFMVVGQVDGALRMEPPKAE